MGEQSGKRKKRKAYNRESSRWPNNIVPYTIESGTFSEFITLFDGRNNNHDGHLCKQAPQYLSILMF